MKLTYFAGDPPNFGDELNPLVWNAVLPNGFLDEREDELFLGIGSIVQDIYPKSARKYVVGSGYGGYSAMPDVRDGSWECLFVRGPRTAKHLGLPADRAICDPAVLLRLLPTPAAAPGIALAFMPHYESLERGFWQAVCRTAGVTLIDPRDDAQVVLSQIKGATLLITEAMHGAIVADALRTPWIAAKPLHQSHRMKWLDWSESLGIDLRPCALLPSNFRELYHAVWPNSEAWRAARSSTMPSLELVNRTLTWMAAKRLLQLARAEPQMSRDTRLDEAVDRVAAAVDRFVRSRGGTGLQTTRRPAGRVSMRLTA
jgi:succinoglycan biosynthesis protein ExoV